jgi:hypothetical protein
MNHLFCLNYIGHGSLFQARLLSVCVCNTSLGLRFRLLVTVLNVHGPMGSVHRNSFTSMKRCQDS